ncbi:xylulokinase [Candidatus Thorarchaeota archaeon]|nr:MAG: xylulokinase [Candidatus Thorarchaeota archaeon]
MDDLVLAIDAGTTGVRSMIFETSGGPVSRAYEEFESLYPRPSWVEQDATRWWDTTCSTIKRALKAGGMGPERIAGISVTNQRETVVPVDSDGIPLRHAIVWQDRRTVPECDWIRDHIGPEMIYEVTGLTIDPYFTAPKLLWIKKNEPEVFKNTECFLLVHDFIVHRLTGHHLTDFSNASRTMLFDIEAGSWSERLLQRFEIPLEKLPEPVLSGTTVGEVSEEAAAATGLNRGTPVVAGGGDQQCAALGVGVVREGLTKCTTGTGTFMLVYSESARRDLERRVLCSRHVVPDAFVVEASMFTTGSALRWFRDNLGAEECALAEEEGIDPYDIMTDEASSVAAGAEGVIHLPHFVGAGAPHWNPHARGVFAGLALGHGRNHLLRAILEGVAYEIRSNLEVVRDNGLAVSEMRVTGGAARSEVWMQIQSDVLNIPVIRTEMEEATALGAAILACKGIGVFDSVVEAAEEMVRGREPLTPNPEHRAVYEEGYDRYRRLYNAISDMRWD